MMLRAATYSVLTVLSVLLLGSCESTQQADLAWPTITKENRPWTRWWWEGSAVTKEGITAELESLKKNGIGGVEITPIYGVYGRESDFINFLSPNWVAMLEHTLKEADRLGLGVDMATGTGWPFGGPWVSSEDACKNMNVKQYALKAGESVKEPILFRQEPLVRSVGMQIYEMHGIYKVPGQQNKGTISEPAMNQQAKRITIDQLVEPISNNKNLQALALDQVKFDKQLKSAIVMAYSKAGEVLDLLDKVDANNKLQWTAPDGEWTVYAIFPGWHGKMVERAAPGGEGNVIDHFSETALKNYLHHFDTAFSKANIGSLRAFFNDSYEVDDARGSADWTADLFGEFEKRRGYDLKHHLPALFSKDTSELQNRVLCDYRETISELVHDRFTKVWHDWAKEKGAIIRNQAHGSPANILDLYAEVDIPEMEGTEPLRIKMASSSGNVTGKPLVSSESATWLNEHFKSNLADIKQSIDRYLVNGVNHVFYHGTSYSPTDDPWPGWLFYAAIHMNDRNPLWTDAATLNEYIARCQSFLQRSTSDNDVLLYYPVYDRFSMPGREMIEHFDGVDRQFENTAFKEAAEEMLALGYSFDYISDKQIQQLTFKDGELISGGNTKYQTIVVPHCRYIPMGTLEKLLALANTGATVIFYKGLPERFSGYSHLEENEQRWNEMVSSIAWTRGEKMDTNVQGNGSLYNGDSLDELLRAVNVKAEQMVEAGLTYIRKKTDKGTLYFVTNWGDQEVTGPVRFGVKAKSCVLFNPLTGDVGLGTMQATANGTTVDIPLGRGEAMLVQFYEAEVTGAPYPYHKKGTKTEPLGGAWELTFEGDSTIHLADTSIAALGSWTSYGAGYEEFSGAAVYTHVFPMPALVENSSGVWLDLGTVKESAAVWINDTYLATLIGPKYVVYIPSEVLKQDGNKLTVRVSNLMVNRIASMDRRGVFWKKFYNVNFPARLAENRKNGIFYAGEWAPAESGLVGPVQWIASE